MSEAVNLSAIGTPLYVGQTVTLVDGKEGIVIHPGFMPGKSLVATGDDYRWIINQAKINISLLRHCLGLDPQKKALELAVHEYKKWRGLEVTE